MIAAMFAWVEPAASYLATAMVSQAVQPFWIIAENASVAIPAFLPASEIATVSTAATLCWTAAASAMQILVTITLPVTRTVSASGMAMRLKMRAAFAMATDSRAPTALVSQTEPLLKTHVATVWAVRPDGLPAIVTAFLVVRQLLITVGFAVATQAVVPTVTAF